MIWVLSPKNKKIFIQLELELELHRNDIMSAYFQYA